MPDLALPELTAEFCGTPAHLLSSMPVRELNQDGDIRGPTSADDLLLLLRGGSEDLRIGDFETRNVRQSLRDALSGWARTAGVSRLSSNGRRQGCPLPRESSADGDDECLPQSSPLSADVFMEDFSGPSPCSFLRPGQVFEGTQRVSRLESRAGEDWRVEVVLQDVDLERGTLCGRSVWQLPHGDAPVVTQWEGQVVDNANHSFLTRSWGASRQSDLKHWGKFAAFGPLRKQVMQHSGRSGQLQSADHVFMRWKEQCFVNASEDCGLTIAGFYYVCLSRQTGDVEGYYVDPHSAPNHKLQLRAKSRGAPGTYSSGAFQFC